MVGINNTVPTQIKARLITEDVLYALTMNLLGRLTQVEQGSTFSHGEASRLSVVGHFASG